MKIVQSFWTKPILRNQNSNSADRLRGGWKNNTVHLMSWALSCHQLRKFYSEVELVTDKLGEELLIRNLKLPYTSVKVELNRLDDFGSDLWALGKIFSYGIQTKPFIHVDSDVFIWAKLPNEIESSNLLCQNFDLNMPDYLIALKKIIMMKFYMPIEMTQEITRTKDILGCNAGIIGGCDHNFFKGFSRSAFDFVRRNERKLKMTQDFPGFNLLLEQFLYRCLAARKNLNITPYFNETDDGSKNFKLVMFQSTPSTIKYNHVVADFKKNNEISEKVKMLLRVNYPEEFFKINGIMEKIWL